MATRLTREESRQRTRSLLLDASARVFARRGYHGASLDDIAAEAGFSKGAVYSNFESKEDLFLALLERRRGEEKIALAGAMEEPPDEAAAGLGRLAAPIDPASWQWGLLTVEFFLYAARDPAVRDRLAAHYRENRRVMAELFVRRWPALATGVLAPDEVATVALALASGVGIQAVLDPAAIAPDLYARAISLLLGGSPEGEAG